MNNNPRPIFGNKQQTGLNYLYTKGKQFMLNGVEYVGQYHIYKSLPYTEGEHTYYSKRLEPYYANRIEYEYDLKTSPDFKPLFRSPRQCVPILKDVDYQVGFFFRYFAQKTVEQDDIVYELSESDYNAIGTLSGLNDGLYGRVLVRWKLTGPLRSQIVTNELPSGLVLESEIEGIIDYNQKEIIKANATLPGLRSAILDYAEFARPTNFNPQLPINTAELDPTKVLRDTVPNSVKNVFIKALNNRR